MYDIVFLSYNEVKAEENWKKLKKRFPFAKRVDKVKGIVNAHQKAASLCNTKWFWVVDADNDIHDFSFDYDLDNAHPHTVCVWRCKNNVNDLVYGYGGVKLLPRERVLEIPNTVVDFTTSIGNQFRVMPEIASTTVIDSDPFEAWKSAFRECAKLSSKVITNKHNDETNYRLNVWNTIANSPYRDLILQGAKEGTDYGYRNKGDIDMLGNLNNFNWLREQYEHSLYAIKSVDSLKGIELLYDIPFVRSLRQTIEEYPLAEWKDALSHGQITSKQWLVNTLDQLDIEDKHFKKIYVCASWYGILGELLLDKFDCIDSVRGIDIDEKSVEIANRLMKHHSTNWRFKSTCHDIMDLRYDSDKLMYMKDAVLEERIDTPSMIINTSCEHIDVLRWYDNIPEYKLVVLQSNDYFEHEQHISCFENLNEFDSCLPMNKTLYVGEHKFDKYTRFMKIGLK